MNCRRLPQALWAYRHTLVVTLTPLLLSPLLTTGTQESRCGFVFLLLGVYWATQALPVAATGFLPTVLLPMLGVLRSSKVGIAYFTDHTVVLFTTVLLMVAMENHGLHKRVALWILIKTKSDQTRLLLVFMLVSAFMSMWLSTTTVVGVMTSVTEAALVALNRTNKRAKQADCENSYLKPNDAEDSRICVMPDEEDMPKERDTLSITYEEEDDAEFEQYRKAVHLGVAYSGTIGGMSSLVGTGSNLTLHHFLQRASPSLTVGFGSWFVLAFPTAIICLACVWLWLHVIFLGIRKLGFSICRKSQEMTSQMQNVQEEYKRLGRMSFAEKVVLCHVITTWLLWFTREPLGYPGWSTIFKYRYVSDGSVGVLVAASLFFCPRERPSLSSLRDNENKGTLEPKCCLLEWERVTSRLPWNLAYVIGASFALVEALQASGLSKLLLDHLESLSHLPVWTLVLASCTIVALLAEVLHNTATVTLMLPIMLELASRFNVHPLQFLLPVTISSSFSFVFPVSSPSNLLVHDYSKLKLTDWAGLGLVVKISCILALTLSINTWGMAYFRFAEFSSQAHNVSVELLKEN